MLSINAANVNDLYSSLLDAVATYGVKQGSRNGPVLTMPYPVMVEVSIPDQRVLFDSERNANPFFHLMEALWMLEGRRDVKFLAQFNKNMETFSDDGVIFNGAYGYRWREYFGHDQIQRVADRLRANHLDRKAVITMWDAHEDSVSNSKDVPCNQQMMFRIINDRLYMTTTNRSNDLIWGLCGANAVHLTVLHEYLAAMIGVEVGSWIHMTNNLHVYTEPHGHLVKQQDYYSAKQEHRYPNTFPLVKNVAQFNEDLSRLLRGGPLAHFDEPFIREVAAPVWRTWKYYKEGNMEKALSETLSIGAEDWGIACHSWLVRIREKRNATA